MPTDLVDYTKNSDKAYEFELEIEYVHHLKEFYRRIHRWLQEEGFEDFNGTDKYEQLYWQRDKPNGQVEHHLWWRAWKYPGYDIHPSKNFRWVIQMTARTIATSRQEVMHEGRKWNLYMSNPTFKFTGWIIYDFYGNLTKNPLLRPFAKRFKQWIYKDRKKHFKDELEYTMRDLADVCKAFLKLKQSEDVPPHIYPPSSQPENV